MPVVAFKVSFKRDTIQMFLPDDTLVSEVQVQVERKLHIAADKQKLLFKGKVLGVHLTLAQAGVAEGAKLMLMGKQEAEASMRTTGMRRAYSADAYDSLLASPQIAPEAKARLAAYEAPPRPVTEVDVFLERTASRRQVLAAKHELAALKNALAEPGSPTLARSRSRAETEMARLRAVALEQRMSSELEAVQAEVVALRAELCVAAEPEPEAAPAAFDPAADALMRQNSADEELRLAIAMSMGYEAPEPNALVRQSSAVSADGGPAVMDAEATAARKRKKKKKSGYKEMIAGVTQAGQRSQDEIIAEHRARLAAKINSKETRVVGSKFERMG